MTVAICIEASLSSLKLAFHFSDCLRLIMVLKFKNVFKSESLLLGFRIDVALNLRGVRLTEGLELLFTVIYLRFII